MKNILLIGVFGMISIPSFGQLTLSGEIRPRAEFRHGYKSVADTNQPAAFSIDQRTRINIDYIHKDYHFYVSLQDVRTWGSNSQLNISDPFMSVHQAWIEVNLKANLGIKLGRQEIIYDDQRIFGNVGWAQQARSHDAAIFKYKSNKTKLNVGVAFNQSGPAIAGVDYTVGNSYRDMQYLWINRKIGNKIQLSLLALNLGKQVNYIDWNGDDHTSMNYTQTLGTHIKFNFNKLNFNFNGYVQTGSAPVTPVSPLFGYLIGLDASYVLSPKISVGVGYETQSGTSQTDTTQTYLRRTHNFTPYFGTNHKFNGLMDYFYVGSGHGNVGLQDIYFKLKYKKEKWNIGLDGHLFIAGLGVEVYDAVRYNTALTNATTQVDVDAITEAQYTDYTLGSILGTEIDLSFMYKIKPTVTFKIGYSHLISSETLASLKGVTYTSGVNSGLGRTDQINNWGYVMIVVKPKFLVKNK